MSLVSPVPGPDEITALHELQGAIAGVLRTLTPREAMLVRRYYELEGDGCTYVELGQQLGVSCERVRQIIVKALRKLRHPSRCRLLHPHIGIETRTDPAVTAAAKEAVAMAAKEAEEDRSVRATAALEQAAERRDRDACHLRVGTEIGSFNSSTWWGDHRWGDHRRHQIAEALDRVTSEVVTRVRSPNTIYAYLREHLEFAWKDHEAWKRDIRRHVPNNSITLTRAVMADGYYFVYARRDPCTWYLFDTGYASRWVGYVKGGDNSIRSGRLMALDQSMQLKITRILP